MCTLPGQCSQVCAVLAGPDQYKGYLGDVLPDVIHGVDEDRMPFVGSELPDTRNQLPFCRQIVRRTTTVGGHM